MCAQACPGAHSLIHLYFFSQCYLPFGSVNKEADLRNPKGKVKLEPTAAAWARTIVEMTLAGTASKTERSKSLIYPLALLPLSTPWHSLMWKLLGQGRYTY